MKFSLEWLKEFLDTEAGVDEVAAKLNARIARWQWGSRSARGLRSGQLRACQRSIGSAIIAALLGPRA